MSDHFSEFRLEHLRRRHDKMLAKCDAFLEMIEHRESRSGEPHELYELGLAVRVQSALERAGIHNVPQLCRRTRSEVDDVTGIGRPSADAIEAALAGHGYALKDASEERMDEATITAFRDELDEWGSDDGRQG